MDIWAQAAKGKIRFQLEIQDRGRTRTINGSPEVLWDLERQQLDAVFQALSVEEKATATVSLMGPSPVNQELQLKMALVQYVFNVKTQEAAANEARAAAAAERKFLQERLIELERNGMSVEDIRARLAALPS